MRGARRKSLYRAFTERFGRPPSKMVVIGAEASTGLISYQPSEQRRLKKAYLATRRATR